MAPEPVFSLQSEDADKLASDDVLEALKMADVWETFCALPEVNRDEFGRWIDGAPDRAARRRRIDALMLALRLSPLVKGEAFRTA